MIMRAPHPGITGGIFPSFIFSRVAFLRESAAVRWRSFRSPGLGLRINTKNVLFQLDIGSIGTRLF